MLPGQRTTGPNQFDHHSFVNIGYMPNFSLLGEVEVGKKGSAVGWLVGWLVKMMPFFGFILQA